jgi:hypothetical protein
LEILWNNKIKNIINLFIIKYFFIKIDLILLNIKIILDIKKQTNMYYSTLMCRDYFRTVLEETLRQRGYSIDVDFSESIMDSRLLIEDGDNSNVLTEGDMLFDYIYQLYRSLIDLLSEDYCEIQDIHIQEEISYNDDEREYKFKYFYKEKAKLESTYDFIDCASAYHYGTNLYYEEIFKRKLDKLQPLFMDVINDIYEKYKELMEISSLLEPSLETFSCYITIDEEEYDDIDEEEYDDIEDKSIIYFTPQKYVDTLSSYTHEKEDVVKCILYCFARQDEIPTELALLILSFIGFKRISLFEKYFELLDVDEGSIYCN